METSIWKTWEAGWVPSSTKSVCPRIRRSASRKATSSRCFPTISPLSSKRFGFPTARWMFFRAVGKCAAGRIFCRPQALENATFKWRFRRLRVSSSCEWEEDGYEELLRRLLEPLGVEFATRWATEPDCGFLEFVFLSVLERVQRELLFRFISLSDPRVRGKKAVNPKPGHDNLLHSGAAWSVRSISSLCADGSHRLD